jgi:hypothetical protein
MGKKKPNRPQQGKSQGKGRKPPARRPKQPVARQTPPMSDDLKSYLQAAAREEDVTLEDAQARLIDLDEATIGEFLGDYFTGFDRRYDEIGDDLAALIEQVGDQTKIRDVLPDG